MGCKCFSVPLSPLLVWAYVRMIIAYVALACYMTLLVHPTVVALVWIGLAFIHLTFANIFIVGIHYKTYSILLMFLIYSILEVVLTSAWQVWHVISIIQLSSNDSMSLFNYWRQQLASIECLKFFVLLVFHMLLPIYFIVAIRRELLKIKVKNSVEVRELVKKEAEESNILLNGTVTEEQNRGHNFANSSALAEETLLTHNGTVAEEQNVRYNFANSSAPPEEISLPYESPAAVTQNRRYYFANSSAPAEEILLSPDSIIAAEQKRKYNFANSSAPPEETLFDIPIEHVKRYNFANSSELPGDIALYPLNELKGFTTDNNDQ